MRALADWIGRHKWLVVGCWALILIAALPFAARQSEDLTGRGATTPGSQSYRVEQALRADFPSSEQNAVVIVLRRDSAAARPEIAAALERVTSALDAVPELAVPRRDLRAAENQLAAGAEAVLLPLASSLRPSDLKDPVNELRARLDPGEETTHVTPYLVGQTAAIDAQQALAREDLRRAELTAFPLIALILALVFGSVAAMGLPLLLALVSVTLTGALIFFLSQVYETSFFVTSMASMIGIGVAVDYSLFILARFREELAEGRSVSEARSRALASSGRAVVFSGLAVIAAVAGLWLVDNPPLRSMAAGAMIVVAVSVLAAVLLLPALLTLFGRRLGRSWGRRRTQEVDGFWQRWAQRVSRRPALAALGAGALLLVLAAPITATETALRPIKQFPPGHDVRQGTELAEEIAGGAVNPIQIVAEFRSGGPGDPANTAAIAAARRDLADRPETAAVEVTASERSALIELRPGFSSESEAANVLVDELRRELPATELGRRADVAVGGETARLADVGEQVGSELWKVIAFILLLAFLVLVVALRSIVLPLKAIVLNLLAIAAAYGVLVVVFQWGWLDGLFGFESAGFLDVFNRPLILAVVFGLSMDYELFLLTRIRERYLRHGDNERAVTEALATSARTISSAALIMCTVFAAFVLTGMPTLQEAGTGLAIAVALDATVVRLIMVPAMMQLLGKWNWWLPRWLDRLLPEPKPAAQTQTA